MNAPTPTDKPAFVLVHGSWHGGWCWSRVLPLLRAAGHETHAPTLTGVGERAHLLSKDICVDTHVKDVIGLIEAEELRHVVLVGHSYAGNVITVVADRLQQSRPGLLQRLVYLDGCIPDPGDSWSSSHPPELIAKRVEESKASGGLTFPPPDASIFGLEGADRDWVNRRQTPQPFRVYQDPLHFDAARVAGLPRTFIDCTNPPLATINASRLRVRREPGWQVIEMDCGHDPMVNRPRELAEILLKLAAQDV